MKPKITIVCFLLFTSISFSQNLQVFESFEEFQTAVTNNCSTTELTFEGFNNVVAGLCQVPVLPDPNQECLSPDELVDGFTIQGMSQVSMIAFAEGEFGGTPINIVGPNNTEDTVLLDFSPSVNAVSFSTWQFVNNPSSFSIEVYGENDQLLGSFVRDSSIKALYSFFAISDEPIARIESKANVEVGISSAGVLVGALYFGASNCTTPISIPDPNFEQLLITLGYDDVIDGSVLGGNIESVNTLDVSSSSISNLKGVEAFAALESFTSVDNPLTSIDLSANSNLSQVIVNDHAQLTGLNLKNGFNNRSSNGVMVLSTLDATNNPNLQCIQVDDVALAENNPNWQKDAIAVYSEDCAATLSVNSNDISSLISIYPNPVKDVLTINYSGTINSVEVYSLDGKRMYKNNEQKSSIALNNLASGIYLLKINTDLGQMVKKIIKE